MSSDARHRAEGPNPDPALPELQVDAVFFALVIAGLASSLPTTLDAGLLHAGVPHAVAAKLAALPPVSSMFGALLGINPLEHLLSQHQALHYLSPAGRQALTGRAFFPHLISAPFNDGLGVVFATAAGLSAVAAVASLMRGSVLTATQGATT